MVLFGEVVIPSSRILWDEEDCEQFDSDSQPIQWEGSSQVPDEITNLLIIETPKLTKLIQSCLEENQKPLCTLPEQNVYIYKLKDNNFAVFCDEGKDVIPGEVTEKLVPWIENAKKITMITSSPAANFQRSTQEEMSSCFIRALFTGTVDNVLSPTLEPPNLVTGITAGVISFCHHTEKSASLYVCYLDWRPLDSTTAAPILALLHKLNIPSAKPVTFKPIFKVDSNLYM